MCVLEATDNATPLDEHVTNPKQLCMPVTEVSENVSLDEQLTNPKNLFTSDSTEAASAPLPTLPVDYPLVAASQLKRDKSHASAKPSTSSSSGRPATMPGYCAGCGVKKGVPNKLWRSLPAKISIEFKQLTKRQEDEKFCLITKQHKMIEEARKQYKEMIKACDQEAKQLNDKQQREREELVLKLSPYLEKGWKEWITFLEMESNIEYDTDSSARCSCTDIACTTCENFAGILCDNITCENCNNIACTICGNYACSTCDNSVCTTCGVFTRATCDNIEARPHGQATASLSSQQHNNNNNLKMPTEAVSG